MPHPGVPAGPNLPRRRRALRFFAISLVVLIVSGIVGIVFAATTFRNLLVFGSDLIVEADAGGTDVAELEPGKYLIVAIGRGLGGRDGSSSFRYPDLRITEPDGSVAMRRPTNFDSRTSTSSRAIVVIEEFTVTEAGPHRLEVGQQPTDGAESIGIAKKKDVGGSRIAAMVIAFGVAGLAGLITIIFLIIAILAHRERVPIEPTGDPGPV